MRKGLEMSEKREMGLLTVFSLGDEGATTTLKIKVGEPLTTMLLLGRHKEPYYLRFPNFHRYAF